MNKFDRLLIKLRILKTLFFKRQSSHWVFIAMDTKTVSELYNGVETEVSIVRFNLPKAHFIHLLRSVNSCYSDEELYLQRMKYEADVELNKFGEIS